MAVALMEKGNKSQFVSFRLGTEEYGLDINNVQEIIKPPTITKVPRAPYYIEGIVNLRGNILPIIDTRKRFDMDSTDSSDSTRIVVTNLNNMNVGLVVDSVSEVLRIDSAFIEPPPLIIKNTNGDFLSGIGKLNNGKRLISLLHLEKILEIDGFEAEVKEVIDKGRGDLSRMSDGTSIAEEAQMVSFKLGQEEYAVDINQVEEIIRIPEITTIPDVPYHIKGVICLRGNVLPVVNLRSRFGMEEMDFDNRSRILVIKLTSGDMTALFGIIVDVVNEVISIPLSNIEPPPSFALNSSGHIKGIGKLENGKRLILVLDPSLIIDGAFSSNDDGSKSEKTGKTESGREERSALDEQQLVNLKIGNEEFGINIMNVQEIIRLNHITNVPGAPDYVKGVVNLRGNVLPVIDLRRRFELEDRDLTDSDRIVVVTYQGKATGLIVDSVSEVLQIPGKDIEPPPEVVSGVMSKFIDGIGKLNGGKRFIIILNIAEILGKSREEEPDDLFGDDVFAQEKPTAAFMEAAEEPMEEPVEEAMEDYAADSQVDEELFAGMMEEPPVEEQPKPKAKSTKKKK